MSIVAQLVKKMNGTIQVESTVGEGSSFTVVLPFAIDHDPPAAAEKTPPPATCAASACWWWRITS